MSVKDSFGNKNWADYKGESTPMPRITEGAHLCQIKYVFEFDDYIELLVDVVSIENIADEGKLTHCFSEKAKKLSEENGKPLWDNWDREGRFKLYYASSRSADKDEAAKNLFKARITAIEESNQNYSLEANDFNVGTLTNRYVVGVWQMREYIRKDGGVGKALEIMTLRSIGSYLRGEIETPKRRTIEEEAKKVRDIEKQDKYYAKKSNDVKTEEPLIDEPVDDKVFDFSVDDDELPF